MTLRRAMLKPSMCWTQQSLALLTQSGWTSIFLFHMYDTIFVNSLRVSTLCVYDIVLETLFHMYCIIFVNSYL
jgi:hypothetical protein